MKTVEKKKIWLNINLIICGINALLSLLISFGNRPNDPIVGALGILTSVVLIGVLILAYKFEE